MGEYQRPPNGDDLCLDHIKLYDDAINISNVGRTICPVEHSQIGRRSTLTLYIFTANRSREYSTILFCIQRSSAVHRPTIGLQSGVFWVGRPSADDRTTVHKWKYIVYMYMYTCY